VELNRISLFTSIKNNQIANIYFFLEEEIFFKLEAIDLIKKRVIKNEFSLSFNFNHYYGSDTPIEEIITTANTLPVFSEKRLIIVDEFEKLKKWSILNSYLANPSPTTHIIFNSREKRLPSAIKPSKAVIVKFYPLNERELSGWIIDRIKKNGKIITSYALAKLMEYTDNSLIEIANEIDKLILYTGEKREINESDVEYIIGDNKNYNIFALSDAILRRDFILSLKIFRRIFSSGTDVGSVFYNLNSTFQKIWLIKYFKNLRMNDNEIMREINLRWFQYNKLKVSLNYYTEKKLEEAVKIFFKYDKLLKSSGVISKDILIEKLIYELCN